MKNILLLLSAVLLPCALIPEAHALLIDNRDGTVTETRTDGTRLMWLQDANLAGAPMTLAEAENWVSGLVYGGYSDWRLPTARNIDGTGTCHGYGCNMSEIGYLYYSELGNQVFGASYPDPNNAGPFLNLAGYIWSGTVDTASNLAYDFDFDFGGQFLSAKTYTDYVLAVRSDSPAASAATVPEPGTIFTLGSGLLMTFFLLKKAGSFN